MIYPILCLEILEDFSKRAWGTDNFLGLLLIFVVYFFNVASTKKEISVK